MGKVSSIVALVRILLGLAVRRFEGPRDLAVHHDLDRLERDALDGAALQATRPSPERRPGILTIEGDHQHRPRRDEAPALVQPLQPGRAVEGPPGSRWTYTRPKPSGTG